MTPSRPSSYPDVPGSIEAIQGLAIVPSMLETVCALTGMRFAAIARVTDARWTACAVLDQLDFGLKPGGDLVLDSTICDEIRTHHQPVVFGSASTHPIYSTHHTPRIYGLESYVSVPILSDGDEFFGTLCAIDSEPRDFDEGVIVDTLRLFASLIASHLSLAARAVDAEAALKTEIDTGVLREQFLAVVGHDLRSPLQAALLATDALHMPQPAPRRELLLTHLSRSIGRMSGLVDDIMDFARAKLGAGIPMEPTERSDLQRVIALAVDEVRQGQPGCRIHLLGNVQGPMRFDGKRMRQLLANLLNNAVVHGDASHPIEVRVEQRPDRVDIAVSNLGAPIPPDVIDRLFEPFVRPESSASQPGLGLGLYIASHIASGHGATLSVSSSTERGTIFVFSMPLAEADSVAL